MNQIQEQIHQAADATIDREKLMAACVTLDPTTLNGLASNAEWLLRQLALNLVFVDEDDDELDIQLDLETARKLPQHLALIAKGLREFAELLEALEKHQAA